MRLVRLARLARDDRDLVAQCDEPWHEIGADMTRTTDDDNAHGFLRSLSTAAGTEVPAWYRQAH
jgi:hypothetical protein